MMLDRRLTYDFVGLEHGSLHCSSHRADFLSFTPYELHIRSTPHLTSHWPQSCSSGKSSMNVEIYSVKTRNFLRYEEKSPLQRSFSPRACLFDVRSKNPSNKRLCVFASGNPDLLQRAATSVVSSRIQCQTMRKKDDRCKHAKDVANCTSSVASVVGHHAHVQVASLLGWNANSRRRYNLRINLARHPRRLGRHCVECDGYDIMMRRLISYDSMKVTITMRDEVWKGETHPKLAPRPSQLRQRLNMRRQHPSAPKNLHCRLMLLQRGQNGCLWSITKRMRRRQA